MSYALRSPDKCLISFVSRHSQEPVEKSLKVFGLDLTNNPTIGELLNQARGEKIEVTLQQTATGQPAVLSGVIMGMESKPQPHGKDHVLDSDQLNLLCAEGLRAVPPAQVQRLRFLNARIHRDRR